MSSDLDDGAPVHSDDAGAGTHRRQPMSDDDDGASARDRAHVLLYDTFALIVERRRRFVENQNARIGRERAGNRDSLTLPPERLAPRSSIIVS